MKGKTANEPTSVLAKMSFSYTSGSSPSILSQNKFPNEILNKNDGHYRNNGNISVKSNIQQLDNRQMNNPFLRYSNTSLNNENSEIEDDENENDDDVDENTIDRFLSYLSMLAFNSINSLI